MTIREARAEYRKEQEAEKLKDKYFIRGKLFNRDGYYTEISVRTPRNTSFTINALLTESASLEHGFYCAQNGYTLTGMSDIELPLCGHIVYTEDQYIIVKMNMFVDLYIVIDRTISTPLAYSYALGYGISWIEAFKLYEKQEHL